MTRYHSVLFKLSLPALALLTLTACEKLPDTRMAQGTPRIQASIAEGAAAAPQIRVSSRSGVAQRSATLAYEHAVTVELDEKLIPARLDAVQAACVGSTQYVCELLDVSANAFQGTPSGTLRLRTSTEGVGYFTKLAAERGKVIAKSTHAEDLAQPLLAPK